MSEIGDLRERVIDVQGKLEHLIGRVDVTFEHIVTRDKLSDEFNKHVEKYPHKDVSKKMAAGIIGAITALATAASAIAHALMN
jgi:hypothetical protein